MSRSPTQRNDNPEVTENKDNGIGPDDELKSYDEVKAGIEDLRKPSRSRSGSANSRRRHGRRDRRSMSNRSRSPRRSRSPPRRRRSRSPRRERRPPVDNPNFTQVYVNGIPRTTTVDDLEQLFEKCGAIRDIVMKNKYAFIDFKNHDDAVEAVQTYNKTSQFGEMLTVEQSQPHGGRKRRSAGPQAGDECFNCGKTGHWSNECRSGRRERRRSGSRDRRSRSP